MILVTAKERAAILAELPETTFRRTCPGKSRRHRYYVAEADEVMAMLRAMRKTKNLF